MADQKLLAPDTYTIAEIPNTTATVTDSYLFENQAGAGGQSEKVTASTLATYFKSKLSGTSGIEYTATTGVIATNATSANTPSTIVERDVSGNFSANTITAALNGNATTVTNGVYTTGIYSDPSWLTSIDYTIVSGLLGGCVLFSNDAGEISENDVAFRWDDSNWRLGLGDSNNNPPASTLQVSDNNGTGGVNNGLTVAQFSTGDAVAQFLLNATSRRWIMGADQSDSGKFKIALGSDLGSSTAMTINANQSVNFAQALTASALTLSAQPALVMTSVSATQSIANNTETTVNIWDTDLTNQGGAISHSAGVFTISVPGLYIISVAFSFPANSTGIREIWLSIDSGTKIYGYNSVNAVGSGIPTRMITGFLLLPVAINTTVQVRSYQTSGGALGCGGGNLDSGNQTISIVKLF